MLKQIEILIRFLPTRSRFHQLPAAPRDFIGRDSELARLRLALAQRKSVVIYNPNGIRGVGKTSLGLVAANELAREYHDAQLFQDMRGTSARPALAVDVMKQVIFSIKPFEDLRFLNSAQIASLYKSCLSNKKAVLFFDDVGSEEQLESLLPPSPCITIITANKELFLKDFENIPVGYMPVKDAKRFLHGVSIQKNIEDDEIIRLCGYLPASIRMAGSLLRDHRGKDKERYISQLIGLYGENTASPKNSERTIEPLLDLIYQSLNADERKHWCELSIFPAHFDALAVASIWGIDTYQSRFLLERLCQYNLLTFLPSSRPGLAKDIADQYMLPSFCLEFIKKKTSAIDANRLMGQYAEHYRNMLYIVNKFILHGGEKAYSGLYIYDREAENMRRGLEWAVSNDKKLCSDYLNVGTYINHMWLSARDLSVYSEAALSAARELDDKPSIITHLGSLAIACFLMGQIERAIELHNDALEIARKTGDLREGIILCNLGDIYLAQGDFHKASDVFEKGLPMVYKGGYKIYKSDVLIGLASAYFQLREYQRAIQYFKKAIPIARNIGDQQQESLIYYRIAAAYASTGKNRESLRYYRLALTLSQRIGDRNIEKETLHGMGNVLVDLNKPKEAVKYLQRWLSIAKELDDGTEEGLALYGLGCAYHAANNIPAAKESYKQAEVWASQIHDSRLDVYVPYGQGTLLADQQSYPEGIELLNKALTHARKYKDQDMEEAILFELGRAYELWGKADTAIEFYKQTISAGNTIDDPSNRILASWNTGLLYEKNGNLEKAIESMQFCVDYERKAHRPEARSDAIYLQKLIKKQKNSRSVGIADKSP